MAIAKQDRRMLTRTCRHCSTPFLADVYHVRHRERAGKVAGVYCSRRCHEDSKRVLISCARCGKGFRVMRCHRHRKYCSQLCAGVKAVPVELNCETCGKGFEVTPHKARAGRRFCSKDCASAGYTPLRAAPFNRARFYSRAWRGLRLAILDRDDRRCRLCSGGRRLAIHHVIPWEESQDDSPENLVTLCSSCHLRAEKALRNHGEILCVGAPLEMGGVPSL